MTPAAIRQIILTGLGAWQTARRRNRVIGGLLTSIYAQAQAGSYTYLVEDREGETTEAHDTRVLTLEHGQMKAALLVIGLMVRNELASRNMLHLVEPPTNVTTMRRTVAEKPE